MTTKLKKPSIPYSGWTIESDIGQKTVDLSAISLHLEPEQKTGRIEGHKLREKLAGQEVMSAAVLDYLIEHPEETPESWKKNENGDTNYVFFWGTIFRGSDGDLCVRFWYWGGGRWQSSYGWLGGGWGFRYPSAVLRKPSDSDARPSSGTLNLEARVAKLEAIVKHHNLSV